MYLRYAAFEGAAPVVPHPHLMFRVGSRVAVADADDARFGRVGRVVSTNDPDNPIVEFEGWKFNKIDSSFLVTAEGFRRIKWRTIFRLRYLQFLKDFKRS